MAAFRNNSTSPECENTSFLITDLSSNGGVIGIGILQLVVALFCISLVVCLLLRLKGRVLDSSAKRFTLAVMVCFTLSFLNNAALFFSIQYSPTGFYVAYFFINACCVCSEALLPCIQYIIAISVRFCKFHTLRSPLAIHSLHCRILCGQHCISDLPRDTELSLAHVVFQGLSK